MPMMSNLIPDTLIILLSLSSSCSQLLSGGDPDKNRDAFYIIHSRGYIDEYHSVLTNDGYFIALHHVISPYIRAQRQPILFVPADGGSGIEWARNSPGGSANESTEFVGPNLAFECVKRGFDVWLMDNRGGYPLSINHTNYNADHDLQYWDYSLDDLGLFDLPAVIDYVRMRTSRNKIALVALQYSTTEYFFLAASVPRFNQIVQPFIAVEPCFSQLYSKNDKSKYPTEIDFYVKRRGQAPLFYPYQDLVKYLCRSKALETSFCNPLIYLISTTRFPDSHIGSVNLDRLVVYGSTGPTSESGWQMAQQYGLHLTNRIRMLNVTPEENFLRYGFATPPEYDPGMITNPEMHFVHATSDQQFTVRDINELKGRLGVRLRSEVVIPADFTALSFQDGRPEDVIRYVNIPILRILQGYS